MIELIHHRNPKGNVAFHEGKKLDLIGGSTILQLIDIAQRFPKEWIGWSIEKSVLKDWQKLKQVAHSPHIMVSKGAEPKFLKNNIDYIEDTPFIKFKENSWYPTWLMSDQLGLVHASVLEQVNAFKSSGDFEFDLNLLSRKLQPLGVFCYSQLGRTDGHLKNDDLLYLFVVKTRKRRWLLFLFFCHLVYEKRFPFFAFAKANLSKFYDIKIDTISYFQHLKQPIEKNFSYDVVIPTMGRPEYLKDVLIDLNNQEIKPQNVVIVEQNSDLSSSTQLDFIDESRWQFKIIHRFTHITGACRARNEAIKLTTSPWILLFDDDNRFPRDLMRRVAMSLENLGCKVLNLAYLQKGDNEHQKGFLQWAFFGSGSSIAHREAIQDCEFDMALEHGYGEDVDFGMQLRNKGYDVVYAPEIQVLHLKAPVGGFRKPVTFEWSTDAISPQPSPHIMYFRRKNFSTNQMRGYKLLLFLKNYRNSQVNAPWAYYRLFEKRWKSSLHYSEKLKHSE